MAVEKEKKETERERKEKEKTSKKRPKIVSFVRVVNRNNKKDEKRDKFIQLVDITAKGVKQAILSVLRILVTSEK